MIDIAEGAIISRVAEAIHRSEAEREALAAGVRTDACRRAAEEAQCVCATTAQSILQAAAVPEQGTPNLHRTVQVVMEEIQAGEMADLAGHPYGEYRLDDHDDRITVQIADQQGRNNLATYAIMRDSCCRYARRVARNLVARHCPGLTAAAAVSNASVVGVAPVLTVGSAETMEVAVEVPTPRTLPERCGLRYGQDGRYGNRTGGPVRPP